MRKFVVKAADVKHTSDREYVKASDESDGLFDEIDDVADTVEDLQDSVDDVSEDVVDISVNNNIADHYIAECDSCHGVFISAVVQSDQDVRSVSGICPLCTKETTQTLKWVIKTVSDAEEMVQDELIDEARKQAGKVEPEEPEIKPEEEEESEEI